MLVEMENKGVVCSVGIPALWLVLMYTSVENHHSAFNQNAPSLTVLTDAVGLKCKLLTSPALTSLTSMSEKREIMNEKYHAYYQHFK